MKRSILPALLLCASCPQVRAADVPEVKIDRIVALAKTYFRDSAEIPMDIAVTTIVTDKSGKPRQRAQSSVRMVFNGYNQQSGRLSLHANSGWFNTGALRDSMSGSMAAFVAALFSGAESRSGLRSKMGSPATVSAWPANSCNPPPGDVFHLRADFDWPVSLPEAGLRHGTVQPQCQGLE